MGLKCAKYFMIILNVLVFLTGGVFFVTGILLKVDSGLLETNAITFLNTIEYASVQLGTLANAMAFLMMIAGGIIMLIAILGMCGAWKKIRPCLMVYIIIIIVMVLTQAVLAGLWINFRGRTDEWLKGKLQDKLLTYAGPQSTDTISAGFNTLFMKAHCCGVTGATSDFTSTTWKTTHATEYVPATCCQGVDSTSISKYIASATCTTVPKNYYTDGCYDVIVNYINTYSMIIIIASAGLVIVQVMAIIAACIVMDNAKNKIRHSGDHINEKQPARPPPYGGIGSVTKTKKR